MDDGGASIVQQAARLTQQGVHFFQLREKDLPAGRLADLARRLLAPIGYSSMKLLINGRADVAVAVGAHGVHLTSHPEELTPAQVHWLYTQARLPAPVITVSCHRLQDVRRRCKEPVDAILFGPVFEKVTACELRIEGSGVAALREACVAAGPIPVLALGGITTVNTAMCLHAGARGIAGIRLFQ